MRSLIMFVVIVFVSVCLFFIYRYKHPNQEVHSESFYARIDKQNDSLKSVNSVLALKLNALTIKVDSFSRLVDSSKSKVIYINKKSNEKYQTILNYSNNELYQYFSNFKASIDSGR